jgi:hypothetical protein
VEGEKASLGSQVEELGRKLQGVCEQLASSDKERAELEEALGLMEQVGGW